MTEQWNIVAPGGPAGPFWGIVTSTGRVIAMQIPSESDALAIIAARTIQIQLESKLSSILEHAAHAWVKMEQAHNVPQGISWPPQIPHSLAGTSAYHIAAMIDYAKQAYDLLPEEVTD